MPYRKWKIVSQSVAICAFLCLPASAASLHSFDAAACLKNCVGRLCTCTLVPNVVFSREQLEAAESAPAASMKEITGFKARTRRPQS